MIGAVIAGVAALAGGAISAIGNRQGYLRRNEARMEAIQDARVESFKGIHEVAMNTMSFTQDLTMIAANSGVSAEFGTPKQKRELAYQANIAQANMIEEDYQDFRETTLEEDKADRISTNFSILGGLIGAGANAAGQFSTLGYKNELEDFYARIGKSDRLGKSAGARKVGG
jgi:hypothetical protein